MDSFKRIRQEIVADPSNAWAGELGYAPIFVASESARLLIISQAPGRRAQQTGVPWNDASGRLLRSWLGTPDEEFYDADKVAIVPMDFYFPGKARSGDLPPRRDFAQRWHPRILERLPEVRLTVLVGSYAQRHYLGARAGATLTETVRAAPAHLPFFPIVHPSPLAGVWRRRNPWFEEETVPLLAAHVRSALSGTEDAQHDGPAVADSPGTGTALPADRLGEILDLLNTDREQTLRRISSLDGSVAAIVDAAKDTATDDEHDPEGTTIAYERSQASALLASARHHLVEVDEALLRIDRGTYGVCAVCRQPILPERLLARPAARTCVACA